MKSHRLEPNEHLKYCEQIIDEPLALFIKKLRVNNQYSWRKVAEEVHKSFPKVLVNTHEDGGGFQTDGGNLCYAAQYFLHEENNLEWN